MALSIACALASLWTRAWRWRYLFPADDAPPGLLAAIMIGYMANNILPLRAGEVMRVYVVARRWGRGFWTTLATLIVERVLDGLAVVLILAALVFVIPVPPLFEWAATVLLVVDLLGMAVLVALAVAPAAGTRAVAWILRRWPRLQRRAVGAVGTFTRGLEGVRTASHVVPLVAWSVLIWVLAALSAWAMLRAVNLPLPLVVGWTVLAFVGLGVSIPSAPGYVGVFHVAATWALAIFGIAQTTAVGYALLFHASQFIPVTLLGWIFLLREHLTLGEARTLDSLDRGVEAPPR